MKSIFCKFAVFVLPVFIGWESSGIDRYVSPLGSHTAPFLSWDEAATNIQDAIDAASAGDIIWVTNGIYETGGKVMFGDLTNRVALDKPVIVQSVNGPNATIIRGAGNTNGPTAVRCAWLTNGASLIGFALTAGATRITLGENARGGGVRGTSIRNAFVSNCIILSNSAYGGGGGTSLGRLNNCLIMAARF
jgi:hypothetical protein